MFRRCTGRLPEGVELTRLREVLEAFHERYTASAEDAAALLALGEAPLPEDMQALIRVLEQDARSDEQ